MSSQPKAPPLRRGLRRSRREEAEAELGESIPLPPLTDAQMLKLLEDYKKNLKKMAKANPVHKAQFYAATGIELTYHPDRDVVEVTALPQGVLKNVSEGRSLP